MQTAKTDLKKLLVHSIPTGCDLADLQAVLPGLISVDRKLPGSKKVCHSHLAHVCMMLRLTPRSLQTQAECCLPRSLTFSTGTGSAS